MAVTEWVVVCVGVTAGAPRPMPGVVVNGAGTGASPSPFSGRGYPR